MGQRRLIVIVDYTYCKMGLASILTEHIVQNAHLFQYAHIILTVLTIRKEWSSAGIKGNPLAAFMLSMVCCNAGGFITAFLTGNKAPITIIFKLYADPTQMTIFLATFWLAFFAHESVASSLTRPSQKAAARQRLEAGKEAENAYRKVMAARAKMLRAKKDSERSRRVSQASSR